MESSFNPILHIEDDENDVLLLKRAMGSAGISHPIQVLKNGERALDYLQGKPPFDRRQYYPFPSLILLDLGLPLLNGLEVLRWRQTQPRIKCIPLLVLTASQEPLDVIAAYEAGANGYLAKPGDFNGLVAMMKSIQEFWLVNNIFAPLAPVTAVLALHSMPDTNNHHASDSCHVA